MPWPSFDPPDRIYTFENLVPYTNPQHQQIIYSDPELGAFPQRLTIYTGEIWVGHGAGQDEVTLTFNYPLLGFFQMPGGWNVIGIFPCNDPVLHQLRSAVATVSISRFSIKDTTSWVGVFQVSANLFQIELDPRRIINAVVLQGAVTSQQSEVTYVSYRVSVLERMTQNPPLPDPIFLYPGQWTGKYNLDADGRLGPVIMGGIPQSP